jgi:hypothetical protein
MPKVWPNPFKPKAGEALHIGGVAAGTRVDVFDVTGKWARSLEAVGDPARDTWDGMNGNGRGAVLGVYLVVIRQPGGRTDVLRVAVL